ncbi:YqaJ viral recombinase family protein [Xanthomonas oryzae]|uniref:YqaJ viral recombinase family protein n=1 Tax=Xanthomonas oryzae TaxID=347 RepID=UPI003CCF60BF
MSGEPLDEGFETFAMRRGHELEPYARAELEVQTGLMVQRAGFVLTDDGAFGASADGLIGDDDGVELKCFIDPLRLRRFHIDNDASEVFEQAQGACGSPVASGGTSGCTAPPWRRSASSCGGSALSATRNSSRRCAPIYWHSAASSMPTNKT